jgi:organic radical activating enzyme
MKKQNDKIKAPISEIFFSYQGEGLFVGQPQVFIRFCGCNLRCNYCDTPQTQTLPGDEAYFSMATIIEKAKKYARRHIPQGKRTVALTGGEPLLYATFLQSFLPELKRTGAAVYLETNGTLPESLKKIIRHVDVVSMDMKLPSACGETWWDEHREFLRTGEKKTFVKVVLTGDTTDKEIRKVIALVSDVSTAIPLVFQPATASAKCSSAEPPKIFEWTHAARKKLKYVHVLPQMHKIWTLR